MGPLHKEDLRQTRYNKYKGINNRNKTEYKQTKEQNLKRKQKGTLKENENRGTNKDKAKQNKSTDQNENENRGKTNNNKQIISKSPARR